MSSPARIGVELGARRYDVVLGHGVLTELAAQVPLPPHARHAALVTNPVVDGLYGAQVRAALTAAGLAVTTVTVPDGESAKRLDVLADCYAAFAAIPLGRDDVVVALGGGVVGDLGGFAAATWHRGVALVQVPTTLLAQVDAAIGGKTGVNLPEGKNLVGAFHQPLAVLADTATLATLPLRERRAGLGELAKYGFIDDAAVLTALERDPSAAVAGDPGLLADPIRRGIATKARIVAADEQEGGERMLLNYGHTIGHAIEALTGYTRYLHGEAVGLGMLAVARIGEELGVSEDGLAARTAALLADLGLPTDGVGLAGSEVRAVLGRDKKARAARPRFVLCRQPGQAFVTDEVPAAAIDRAVASLA